MKGPTVSKKTMSRSEAAEIDREAETLIARMCSSEDDLDRLCNAIVLAGKEIRDGSHDIAEAIDNLAQAVRAKK